MGRPTGRGQVAGVAVAIVTLLGGGGGAGYYLHGADGRRESEEHAQFAQALRDCTSTNQALRDAVVMLTERLGATRDDVKGLRDDVRGMDVRIRALETGVRPASMRR